GEVRRDREHNRKDHKPDIIAGENETPDRHIAANRQRLIERVGARTPQQLDDILENQERRVGDENDHDLVAAIDHAQQAALDDEAKHEPDHHRDQYHEQKTASGGKALIEIHADRDRRPV